MTKGKGIKRAASSQPPPEKITNKTPSPPGIKEIGGSGYYVWDMIMIDRTASTSPTFMADGEDYTKKMAAIALRSFEPADAVEGMLAAQAVALHHASLECGRRAMLQGRPGEIASKLRKDAANSARATLCGARTRQGGTCRHIAMANGRCRFHGGLSTGAKTAEGLARVRTVGLVHGGRSRETTEFRRLVRELRAEARKLVELA